MMNFFKKIVGIAIAFFMLGNCSHTSRLDSEIEKSVEHHFAGKKGCFLLFNMKTEEFDTVIGEEECRERYVPCSTFKVPLSVMAFDSGILKDENQTLRWNGVKGFLEKHNHDHNAKTWMRDSVVWFSQRLTPQLGKNRIEKYLQSFQYGNHDFSAGITESWLVSPGEKTSALKVSAYEQVKFIKNLWTDNLPVSKKAMQTTRGILFLETSPKGFRLSGKTGTNFYDKETERKMRKGFGWFIGHIEKDNQEYVAVTNFSDLRPTDAKTYGGPRAKEITKNILLEKGLW